MGQWQEIKMAQAEREANLEMAQDPADCSNFYSSSSSSLSSSSNLEPWEPGGDDFVAIIGFVKVCQPGRLASEWPTQNVGSFLRELDLGAESSKLANNSGEGLALGAAQSASSQNLGATKSEEGGTTKIPEGTSNSGADSDPKPPKTSKNVDSNTNTIPPGPHNLGSTAKQTQRLEQDHYRTNSGTNNSGSSNHNSQHAEPPPIPSMLHHLWQDFLVLFALSFHIMQLRSAGVHLVSNACVLEKMRRYRPALPCGTHPAELWRKQIRCLQRLAQGGEYVEVKRRQGGEHVEVKSSPVKTVINSDKGEGGGMYY